MLASGVLYLVGACISGISLRPWLRERYSSFPDWDVPSFHPDPDASARFPTTITRNVKPLQCHSHNDYWRHVPLYEALHFGCTSVEADIWLMDDMEGEGESDFYIGHSLASLERRRTLRNLYINPLLRILDSRNYNTTTGARSEGVFETKPTQALVLLVDIKNEPTASFDALSAQLEPLRARGYLTYHDGTNLIPGPLTIVATGSTPYTSILAQNATHRDIFFDAPLGDLATSVSNTAHPADIENSIDKSTEYNTTTSLYASQSLRKVLGHPIPFLLPGSPSQWQLERIRSATEAAHARGLKVRWWDTPDWPRSRRNRVWKILMEEGADVLNVDDLRAARDWDGW
jgi:hypothetical protein